MGDEELGLGLGLEPEHTWFTVSATAGRSTARIT
jgi:hypothetical protein